MHTTTAQQLHTIARLWEDLDDALGTPVAATWPPASLRTYLATLEQHDATEAAALRALERSPDQLGTRPVPINLAIHDTKHAVKAVLLDTADRIARSVQRAPIQPPAPARAAYAQTRGERLAWEDRARRIRAARADACDTRRWQPQHGRTAIRAALWLSGRVEGRSGPFRPLSDAEQHHIARVAAGALARIEQALDLAHDTRELAPEHTCQCGGRIVISGGAGDQPTARCRSCGALWTEAGVMAA